MTKLVSIVLPTYNDAHYLPAALEGVFAQTHSDYELIVVNDGSTDDTASVLADHQWESRFTVIDQENQGLPRALNTGFAHATGDYLTWTSSDNVMLPDMLAVLVEALSEEATLGLVYADFRLMDENGRDRREFATVEYDRHWLLYTNLVHCCFLYRRECLERVGGYDPDFVYAEDWEYWIRISQHFPMKRVPRTLYRYRIHKASMTAEIAAGTADRLTYRSFAAAMRRRMPLRWLISRLKRHWARLRAEPHPVVQERRRWMRIAS